MSCGYSEERLALWMDSSELDLSIVEFARGTVTLLRALSAAKGS